MAVIVDGESMLVVGMASEIKCILGIKHCHLLHPQGSLLVIGMGPYFGSQFPKNLQLGYYHVQ